MSPITISSTVYGISAKEKFDNQDSYKNSVQERKININLIFAANVHFVMYFVSNKMNIY